MPLQIIRNDIVNMEVDAVVNTANPEPVVGRGTDSAIYMAAGYDRLLKARQKIGHIEPGEAALTRGYALPARFIIHTVGPVWRGGDFGERNILRKCYRNALELAEWKRCRSVAFPLISSGCYGFPKDEALEIAVDVIRRFLQDSDMEVYLVVFGRHEYELSGKIYDGVVSYIDDHYVYARKREEYPEPVGTNAASFADDRLESSAVPHQAERESRGKNKRAADDYRMNRRKDAMPRYEASAGTYMPYGAQNKPKSGKTEKARPGLTSSSSVASGRKGKPRSLDEAVAQLGESFPEMLFRLIDEKGMTDVEVYKRANIDRKLFSKIRSKKGYQPGKKTAIALAIALRLNLDQTKDLLSRAGYALSPGNKFDVIVEYFITIGEYDIDRINIVLFDYHEQLLGA